MRRLLCLGALVLLAVPALAATTQTPIVAEVKASDAELAAAHEAAAAAG